MARPDFAAKRGRSSARIPKFGKAVLDHENARRRRSLWFSNVAPDTSRCRVASLLIGTARAWHSHHAPKVPDEESSA